jgi:hypothetical protein
VFGSSSFFLEFRFLNGLLPIIFIFLVGFWFTTLGLELSYFCEILNGRYFSLFPLNFKRVLIALVVVVLLHVENSGYSCVGFFC